MKTLMTLENLLRLAGVGHFAILTASALVPKMLDWKSALRPLPPFLRTLFWVYGAFVVLTIAGFGVLTLINARAMAAGDPVARSLAGFIAAFWGARLVVQLFVFDARPHLTNAWLRSGYQLLTAAFVFLTVLFGATAFHPNPPSIHLP